MKNPFKSGDQKTYRHRVTEADIARFESGLVHPFYATFALGRDAEWAGRLFVLEMKEEGEEGTDCTENNKDYHRDWRWNLSYQRAQDCY